MIRIMRGGHSVNRWRAVFGFIGFCACGSSEASRPQSDSDAGGNGDAGATGGSSAGGSSAGGSSAGGSSAGGSGGGAATSGSGGSAASSGAGGTVAPDASQRAACRYYLAAACRRLAECEGTEDVAGCAALLERCPDYFFSPGSTRTIATLLSCAAEWATLDCGPATRSGNPDCASRGTRQTGEECVFASQCASLRCSGDLYSQSCGSCLAEVALGSPCASGTDCGPAQDCVAGRCAAVPSQPPSPAPAAAGAPCTGRCVAGYACVASAGSTERRCAALPGPGSPCSAGLYACRQDAYCTSALQCVAVPGAGAACGYDNYGSARCVVGTVCNRDTDPNGVCIARRALGEGCRPAYSECIEDTECTRDQVTTQYICKHLREEGQTCTDEYDECAPATTCTAGRCVASGELGIFADICGP
jgi:hypothetical protein